MPCGGCGGGDIRIAQKGSIPVVPSRSSVNVQRQLRPKPIQRVASPPKAQKRIKVRSPELIKASKSRASSVRLCPICGASLSIEITGRTRRKRFRCARCRKTYT
jgi:hypothetical protein